mgnify:FL=1
MADNTVFVIKAPDLTKQGQYLAIIIRGGVMGGGSSAFVVDKARLVSNTEMNPHTVELLDVEGNVEVSFPYGTPYLLTKRENVEFLSTLDMAKRQKDEEAELKQLWVVEDEPVGKMVNTDGPRGHAYI